MTNHADLIAALRIPMNVTLPGAPELDEYDEQRKAAADALEAIQKSNEVWRKNSLETWSAMRAMRDAINEYTPMPSIESDLLQGPENSVFCANVAEAVIVAIVAIEAVCNEATAAAYGAAAKRMAGLASAEYSINNTYEGELFDHARGSVASLTPQSARDWLAEREVAIRADERAKAIGEFRESPKFCDICKMEVHALHTHASRAIPIKEKDDE